MRIRTSRKRNNKYILAKFYSKAEPQPQQDTNSQQNSQKKLHCSQVSNGNKNRLDHESFYQIIIERLLHLNPET